MKRLNLPRLPAAFWALCLFGLCAVSLPALAQDGAESHSPGALDMLGVGLLFLSAILGAFVRRHNWWKVCLAALVLGAAGSACISQSFATGQEDVGMSIVGGLLMGAPVFGFVALLAWAIRAARGKAAPAPAPSAEAEAAAPAVERAAFSAPVMERRDFSAPSMERTDFSAPGASDVQQQPASPDVAQAKRAKDGGALAKVFGVLRDLPDLLREIKNYNWGNDLREMGVVLGLNSKEKEASWRGIAISSIALVVTLTSFALVARDEIVYRSAQERQEITATLSDVSSSCNRKVCRFTPTYTYSFGGKTHTATGATVERDTKFTRPIFAKTRTVYYYKDSSGEWKRGEHTNIFLLLGALVLVLLVWVVAGSALVRELKKLRGRGQGEVN
ncbi:MAG: hypothetical protein J6T92_04860 [Ottowia sp.]|nr:hypothetical protein [Ottowia sp.]